jgi:hypothetical protein
MIATQKVRIVVPARSTFRFRGHPTMRDAAVSWTGTWSDADASLEIAALHLIAEFDCMMQRESRAGRSTGFDSMTR